MNQKEPPASDDPVIEWLRSRSAPQASIYRLAAFAAVAAYVAVILAGGPELEGDEKTPYFFKGAYYSVVAQILPVLFLTFAVERRFFRPSRTQAASAGALIAFVLVVVVAAIGELCTLAVIGIRDAPPSLKAWASQSSAAGIAGALVLVAGQAALDSGVLKVLADVLEDPSSHLKREQSFWTVAIFLIGIPSAAVIIWTSYVNNSGHVRQWVLVAAALLAIAAWLRISIIGGRLLTRLLWLGWGKLRAFVTR